MMAAAAEPPFDLKAEKRQIDRNFAKIALPAFAQFAAEPLARLIDTAYLGRLGPAALGGAGAAIAAQYAVAKLYNDPLLRSTISIVAAQEGRSSDKKADAIATALLLALVVGVAQGLVFALFSGPILSACCVGPGSSMRAEAMGYLRICAAGAPTTTLWLVINGIFRGLGDTATPLLWALVFTALNAALDPILIFQCGMGAAGAAAGTAISQTIALVPMVFALRRKLYGADANVPLKALLQPAGGLGALRGVLRQYMSAGGLVLLRTVGKISAYSVCAREAARLGAVASAAHNLCFQLGVATTQICESLAIAMQTLLARELGRGNALDDGSASGLKTRAPLVRHIVKRGLTVGLLTASSLASLTLVNRRGVICGLTTNPEVRAAAVSVLPFVLLCQALKGLAYPVNGALMGALDWSASAVAMWAAQLGCLLTVLLFSRGGTRVLSLNDLWTSLAVLFTMQIVVGLARMFSGRGPWAALKRAGAEEAAADAAVAAAAAAAAAPPVVSWYDSGQRLK
jgi:putative MATE family efflux protein